MMENPVEWFQMKLNDLNDNTKKHKVLSDMKSFVLNSEKTILKEVASKISLNAMFDYLYTSTSQELQLMCTIIYELLCEMPASELLETYGQFIYKTLTHPCNKAKETSLKLLEKSITENTIDCFNKNQSSLLIEAVECLASSERSTAQESITVLLKIGSFSGGVQALYSTSILNKLKEVMTRNDISRFRVYEVVVAVSKKSSENLTAAISDGFMSNLIQEMHSTDILIQLNALEILSNLATSSHGLNYLNENNIVEDLINKLLNIDKEPLSYMLLPGLIEFVGNICVQQPIKFSQKYPLIIDLLFKSMDSADETLLGVLVTTIAKIGSSCNGRLVFIQYKDQMNIFFKKVSNILMTQNVLTVNVMNSLSELFKRIDGDTHCNEITEYWFESIGPQALDRIVTLSKLPFIPFRLSGFTLLKAIATHQWGIVKIIVYAGMVEFLLDRTTEFNKDCKQMKYEIVYNIVKFPNVVFLLSSEILTSLNEFVQEGPFFVPIPVETATEGAL